MKVFSAAYVAAQVASLALLPHAGAASGQACKERLQTSGNVKAYTLPVEDGQCLVSVGPAHSELTFRQFMFRSDGLFSVLVSTDGLDPSASGTRNYFLFPRRNSSLSVATDANGELVVGLPSRSVVSFSPETARVTGFSGARFIEDTDIHLKNYGGFEFVRYEGLLLDTGWQVHSSAYSQPGRKSLFRDSQNNYCAVNNTEVFEYGRKVSLKFRTDAELGRFLAQRCPTLRLNALFGL